MPPKFSVVIPTYNQADFLKVALRSVLDQSFQDFEVIVVNNHSTDQTLAVISECGDDRVQVINFENHGVIGAARNVGIKASQGDYVAFLDSDDTWFKNKLERVSEAINADLGVGLLCHNQQIIRDGKLAKLSKYGPPDRERYSVHDYLMLVGNCISTSATVVARRYLQEVGFFSEEEYLITVEDYDLWVRLSDLCSFHFIQEVLGKQNFQSSSSSANAELHLRSTLSIVEKHQKELEEMKRPYPKGAMSLRNSKAFFGAARQTHRNGSLKNALSYYVRAIRANPFYRLSYLGLWVLLADFLLGQARRKKITDPFLPGI